MRQGELSWRDRGRLWMRLGIRMILVLLIVLALRYLVPPLLGLLMPFALALVVAWVLNPLVKSLQKRLGLSRGVLSLLLILLAFAVAGGILFGLGHSLVSEISSLIDNWEGIWESLQGGILTIGEELDKFLAYLPDEVETFVNESLDGLNAWLSVWINDAMVGMGTRAIDFTGEGITDPIDFFDYIFIYCPPVLFHSTFIAMFVACLFLLPFLFV